MKIDLPIATRVFATALILPALWAVPAAHAVTYTLIAETMNEVQHDGTTVPMWGYRVSLPGGDLANALAQPLTSPGAALVVPPADNTLSVTLYNRLRRPGVPTSFVVHGLNTAMAPVFTDGTGALCTPGVGATDAIRRACRLRSFTTEVPAGPPFGADVPATYTYTNVRPGTYLYQSGTMPQIQVQMGLVGMMSKDAAPGSVYPGVAYAGQTRVIYSEIDAAMHAVADIGSITGSTLDYDPKYFRAHVYDPLTQLPLRVDPATAPQAMGLGQSHLIRMANAGLQTRVPTLSDGTWALLGEDAQPYPYAREQYSALLPAAKTTEAWIGTGRALTLFDRRMAFTDATGGVAGQFVQFAAASTTPTQLSAACPTSGTQGAAWTCSVTSSTPGATLSLVSGPAGMTMSPTGVMTWTPTNAQAQRPADQAITNPVVVAASSASTATTTSSFAVVVANVNDAPTAAARSYTSDASKAGRVTVAAAQGLKVGAIDVDGDALAVAGVTGAESAGVVVNPADGSFVFTTTNIPAPGSAARTVALQYTLTDVPDTLIKGALPALASAPAALSLTINPNQRPARTATSTTFGSVLTPNVVRFTAPASTFSTPNLTSTTYVTDADGSVNPASMQLAATNASALGTTPVAASCFSSLSGTGGALTGYGTFSLSGGAITFTPSRRSNYGPGGLLNLPIRCTAYFQVSDDLNAAMATRALVTIWVLAN